jgi:transmembrane sensor
MKNKQAKELLDKYKAGSLTDEEWAQLDSWYLHEARSNEASADKDLMHKNINAIWKNVSPQPIKSVFSRNNRILWAAAVSAVIMSAALYLAVIKAPKSPAVYANKDQQQILPGQNRAFLILANGKKIDLSTSSNGKLAKESGLTLTKTKAGQLIYTITDNPIENQQNAFNTIETPNGGQYQVHLPDGTHVWLNASSSLRYPLKFKANERKVELTGEGYFEVAHDQKRPFKVFAAKQEIEVLGTHFDVSAYNDEPAVETTLLQGSVKVTAADHKAASMLLHPGQQSSLKNGRLTVASTDTTEAVAWKNGYFKFNGDMAGILRQLARWYDVEIADATGNSTELQFGGEISRFKDINSVLKIIEATGNVRFKTEGRRITVIR